MNRRRFLQTSTTAAGLALGGSQLRAADALQEAIEESTTHRLIERYRRGSGRITVKARDGKPIPNANVKLEQIRHDVLFGCNLFRFGRLADPALEEAYRLRFASVFNHATLGFYWGSYEQRQGEPQYEYTDRALDWCRENNITCKGHPLAWDHPASSPRWLPNDLAKVAELSQSRVRDCVKRFKGRINIWDVVNEPTDLTRFKNPMNTWATQLGAVPFTRLHLDVARHANPDATLLVNDYRTDPAFSKILRQLQRDGKPMFDAIGIQSHMHDAVWTPTRIREVCDAYAMFHKPIHFTETTVVSGPRLGPGENWGDSTPEGEARQAEEVTRFYQHLFADRDVEAIT